MFERFVEDDANGDGEVEALRHSEHGDLDDKIRQLQGFRGNPFGLVPEYEGDRLFVIYVGKGDGVLSKVGGGDLIPFIFYFLKALCGRGVVREVQPFLGSGGNGLIDGKDLGLGVDDVHMQDPGCVTGPGDSAGIMGIGDLFQYDPEIGMTPRQYLFDPLDPVFCRHSFLQSPSSPVPVHSLSRRRPLCSPIACRH